MLNHLDLFAAASTLERAHFAGLELSKQMGRDAAKGLHEAVYQKGGYTARPLDARSKVRGYAVSVPGHEEAVPHADLTPGHIADYVRRKRPHLLRNPDLHLGAWHNTDDHKVYLDLSEVHDDPKKAYRRAREADQIAVYALHEGASHYLNARHVRPSDNAKIQPAVIAHSPRPLAEAAGVGHFAAGGTRGRGYVTMHRPEHLDEEHVKRFADALHRHLRSSR